MTPPACNVGCSWLLAQALSDNLSQKTDTLFKVTPPVQIPRALSNHFPVCEYTADSVFPGEVDKDHYLKLCVTYAHAQSLQS